MQETSPTRRPIRHAVTPYDSDLFVFPCAPAALHKDNVSGGPPYGLVLPDGCADALWFGATQTPFVAYLNTVFAGGGFPGRTNTSAMAWQIRRDLSAGLLPRSHGVASKINIIID